jgi:hypothetical protein
MGRALDCLTFQPGQVPHCYISPAASCTVEIVKLIKMFLSPDISFKFDIFSTYTLLLPIIEGKYENIIFSNIFTVR